MEPTEKRGRRRLSRISLLHCWKLAFRSSLFLGALVLYVKNRLAGSQRPFGAVGDQPAILSVIWLVFMMEMLLRFVPSSMESMGCQKQFSKNYRPTGADISQARTFSGWRTAAVAAAWLGLNGVIGLLYFIHIIDAGILLLISLAYSVCDMICILFFCPFQTWFLKNRCCATCRIYNWDFAMMFTPMAFVRRGYTWSLLGMSLLLLVQWEYLLHRYPQRFSERTNAALSCANCQEKLCHHKTQLRSFWRKNVQRVHLVGNELVHEAQEVLGKRQK